MKSFVGAMIAFVIIVAGVQVYSVMLNRSVDAMEECVEQILTAADREDWQSCRNQLDCFLNHWETDKKWFAVFIHHEEMDFINEALYEIEMYIRYEKQAETAAKANVLKILLEHIPENERLTPENIL